MYFPTCSAFEGLIHSLKPLQFQRAPSFFMHSLTDGDIYESFAMLNHPVRMAVTMVANH